MAIIYTYPRLTNLEDTDLLLISDTGSKRKPTMSVKLGNLATFINSKIDVGVTSIIAGTGITIDQPTGDVTITATGGGTSGVGGAGTPQQIAMWDTTSSITDSIMEQDLANSKVSLSGSLEMGGNIIAGLSGPTNGNDAANKNYVDSMSDVRQVDITVTPAQMLSLNGGNVIQLLPAPGANRMYYILNGLINLKFNSVAYNFSGTGLSDAVSLQLGTVSLFNDTGLNTTNLNSATSTYFVGDPVSASATSQIPVNVPINLNSTSGMSVSQGNSDLNFSLLYREIDLSF